MNTIKELKEYIVLKNRVLGGGNALSPGERKILAKAKAKLKQLQKKGR